MTELQAKIASLHEIGFSYAAIAKHAGVSASAVSRYMNDKANTKPETIAKMEAALPLIWEMMDAILGDTVKPA